ncbi:hypothetical protein GCM10010174_24430 [Kutzneria viridogrisea]
MSFIDFLAASGGSLFVLALTFAAWLRVHCPAVHHRGDRRAYLRAIPTRIRAARARTRRADGPPCLAPMGRTSMRGQASTSAAAPATEAALLNSTTSRQSGAPLRSDSLRLAAMLPAPCAPSPLGCRTSRTGSVAPPDPLSPRWADRCWVGVRVRFATGSG